MTTPSAASEQEHVIVPTKVDPTEWGIHTPCKDCVFAVWANALKDEDEKPTQVGCATNALNLLEDNGAEIVEAEDEDNNFFVVKGRFCLKCRDKNSDWNKYNKLPGEHTSFSPMEMVSTVGASPKENIDHLHEIVRKEMQLRCAAVIVAPLFATWPELVETINSLKSQTLSPERIIVVNETGFRPSQLRDVLQGGTVVPWNLEQVKEDTGDDDSEKYGRLIQIGVKKVKDETYYCVFEAGFDVPPNYLRDINVALNDKMDRFLMLEPEESYNGLFVQHQLHRNIGGFTAGRSVVEKIKNVAEIQEKEHLVKYVGDVVECLKTETSQ